ncbi:MAG: hypothetical protein ACI92I_000594 [Acidimicrobiales bacterium]|jgi:hypothetical protein
MGVEKVAYDFTKIVTTCTEAVNKFSFPALRVKTKVNFGFILRL